MSLNRVKKVYFFKVSILLVISVFTSCKTTTTVQEDSTEQGLSVLYAINNDGIYQYNYSSNKSKKIVSLEELFIPNSLQMINDSVGIIAIENDGSTDLVYTSIFYHFNLKSKTSGKYKEVQYQKVNNIVEVKTEYYSSTGNITKTLTKTLTCTAKNYRFKKLLCCGIDKYLEEQESSNKSIDVYSEKGSLFINENDSVYPLIEFEGTVARGRRTFGLGYSHPSISADGKSVVAEFKSNSGVRSGIDICLIDVSTKQKTTLIENEQYFKPILSADKRFLLVGKGRLNDEDGELKDNVFLYDTASDYAVEVAISNNYLIR